MGRIGDQPPDTRRDRPAADPTGNPGVITTTVLSGVIAVAAAESVGSGEPLGSPAGILWSVVAVLGVVAMVLGAGLELRRRRQMARERPATEAAPRSAALPVRSRGPELPTGTVTFLFTDIEGSTRLLQDLGDHYGAVRDEHAAILRQAIRDGDGVEVSTEGDSFFSAFRSPTAALGAAVAAQRGLASHGWPARFPVRVRMGLHTGDGCWAGTTTPASTSTGRPGSPGRLTVGSNHAGTGRWRTDRQSQEGHHGKTDSRRGCTTAGHRGHRLQGVADDVVKSADDAIRR